MGKATTKLQQKDQRRTNENEQSVHNKKPQPGRLFGFGEKLAKGGQGEKRSEIFQIIPTFPM